MSKLVQKRLQDVVESHQISLSRLTSRHTTNINNPNHDPHPHGNPHKPPNEKEITIAQAAQFRTFTSSQPPLQNHYGGSGTDPGTVVTMDLNPLERAKPQDLLKDCYHNLNDDGSGNSAREPPQQEGRLHEEEEHDHDHDPDFHMNMDHHKTTVKAITIMAALCEESHELSTIASQKFLPQLALFCQDANLKLGTDQEQNVHVLDEELMDVRDAELLKRIGKFMVTLQNIYNFVTRCQRLVRNMVGQIHGCLNSLYDWSADVESLGTNHVVAGADGYGDPALFGGVKGIMPLVEAIVEILEVLVSIDSVVVNNPELLEAWDLYKSVVMDGGEEEQKGPVPFVDIQLDASKALEDGKEEDANEQDDDDKEAEDGKEEGGANEEDDDDKEAEDGREKGANEEDDAAAAATAASPNPELDIDPDNNENGSSSNADSDDNKSKLPSKGSDSDLTNSQSDDHKMSTKPPAHSKEDLTMLQNMLMQLDFTLLSSRSFLIAIEQNFDPTNEIFQADDRNQNGKPLHIHLRQAIEIMYANLCDGIGTEKEWTGGTSVVGLYGLYCMYRRLLPSNVAPDEKLHRSLCTVFPSKHPMVSLFGELPFFPGEFVSRYAPLDRVKGMTPPNIDNIRAVAKKRLSKYDKGFCRETANLHMKVLAWLIKADAELSPQVAENMNGASDLVDHDGAMDSCVASVAAKLTILRKGIDFARHATTLLRYYLVMHKNLMEPIPSGHLVAIEKLCTIAKSIEQLLCRKRRYCIVSIHKAALKLIAASIFKHLNILRSYVDYNHSSLRDSEDPELKGIRISRIGASLSILESLLKGSSSFSPTRLYAIRVALYACYEEHPTLFDKMNLNELEDFLYQLEVISEIDRVVVDVCDCSFLYFQTSLFRPLMKHMYNAKTFSNLARMHMVFAAFTDSSNVILQSSTYLKALYGRHLYLEQYRVFLIETIIMKEIVHPLVENIENVMRQRIHARNIDEMPMVNAKDGTGDHFLKFLELPPVNLCGHMFSIKTAVERLLEKSLYNSSTVGAKDTNSHIEMMVLAKSYGLDLVDCYLPHGAADQGMDIMNIIFRFEDFLETFNYNMNQQNFIERTPKLGRRSVNIVDIECISMSLSRHGFGITKIVKRIVNDFISTALNNLVQIMSNDLFFSSLAKEKRWFGEEQLRGISDYPYERALAFKEAMMDIQGKDASKSLFVQTKENITKIGNALGFSRLLRSGKLYNANGSRQYSASINETRSSEVNQNHPLTKIFNIFETTLEAPCIESTFFPNLETSNENLASAKINCKILHDLYILYPCLSLLWLEESTSGKEMLRKKIKTSEGYYTDDGFALGCAYLFEVLDPEQGKKVDSLNWTLSFRKKFSSDKAEMISKAEAAKASSNSQGGNSLLSFAKEHAKTDEEIEYTRLQVLAKRLETRQREMEMLQYSVHAARMMFSFK